MNLQWVVPAVGIALLWSLWVFWRRFAPGGRKRPSGVIVGVAAFVVVCIAAGLVSVRRMYGLYGLEHVTRQTLSSGRQIEVLSKSAGGGIWKIEYRTRLPKSQRREIEREAEEIWEGVREEAEVSGAHSAYVFSVRLSSELEFSGWRPWIVSNLGGGVLIVQKRPDGTWEPIRRFPRS
jgi:hypothetical protein